MELGHRGQTAAIAELRGAADMHGGDDASSTNGWHLKEQSATVLHMCVCVSVLTQSHGNQPQRDPFTVYHCFLD